MHSVLVVLEVTLDKIVKHAVLCTVGSGVVQ